MHLQIALWVTFVATAFIVSAALGGKLAYEVAMTGLLGILTYWAIPPRTTGGSDGDN